MGFVKHKREKVGFKWLSDVTWDEIREAEELREVARKYADLIRKVNERIWRAYNEAYEEASKETGIREESLFRVATYFNIVLDNYGYKSIAEAEKLDSGRVYNLMMLQLEKHSEDYGSSLAVEEIGKVINPPEYRLSDGGLNVIFNLNERLKSVVREALRKCIRLYDKRNEFAFCISNILRDNYEKVEWWYNKLDDSDLKEDLKVLYRKLSILWKG